MKCVFLVGNETNVTLYRNIIEKAIPGVETRFSRSGIDARQELEKADILPDVILVDDLLHDMSGFEFCRNLFHSLIAVPRLLMIKKGMEHTAIEALDMGVTDFLFKDKEGYFLKILPVSLQKVALHCENCISLQQIKNALKESEEKFLIAFLLSPYPIAISTIADGRFVEVNESTVKNLGFPREEIIGKTSLELGIIKPETRDILVDKLKENDFFTNMELTLYNKWGEERICLVSGKKIKIGGDECLIQSVNDITQRKQAEKENIKLKNLEAIGTLAGGIARDFNQYLTSIIGSISLAKLSLHDTEKIHRALNRAEEMSFKAADLANMLVTFSDGGVPVYKETSMTSLIKSIISIDFSRSPIRFNCTVCSEIWTVLGDENQLHQVLYSIFLNAEEAMPRGGDVLIDAQNISLSTGNEFQLNEGKYVQIRIKDNGPGIPAEYLDKVFDPFFSKKGTQHKDPLGLGLSICLSILKKHNGHIRLSSVVDQGTSVTIFIPAFDQNR